MTATVDVLDGALDVNFVLIKQNALVNGIVIYGR